MSKFLFTLFLASLLSVPAFAVEKSITSEIHTATGALVGHVKVTQKGKGLTFHVELSGMKPGLHGLHVHAVGKCEGPDFSSSGPHFAMAGQEHGMDNPKGPHWGDLPNIRIHSNGKGTLNFHTDLLTLRDGPNSLRKAGGTSLIVHEKKDDQKTSPSGNSGGRVACAVLFP